MNRFYLIFICFFIINFSFSQSIDSSNNLVDTNRIDIDEIRFNDSIALINKNSENLKKSRDAFNSGLLLFSDKKFGEAINLFSKAILIDSLFTQAYFARAKCYHELENSLAIYDYLKSFELDSSNLDPIYKLAEYYFSTDIILSRKTYSTIVSLGKNEHKALAQLGVISFLEKNYDDAIIFLSESIEISSSAYSLNDRASCYRKLSKFDLALEDYLSAIKINSELPFIYNNLASVYAIVGEFEKAIEYYNKAIEMDKDYTLAYNNLACIFLDSQQYELAAENIQNALAINSEYAPAYNNRGILKHNYEKYDEAIIDFNKAISLNNSYAKAYLNRGISKQYIRDEKGACMDWLTAKKLGINQANKYLVYDCE